MKDCFKKLFHLQAVVVTKSYLEGQKMIIECYPKKKSMICKSCGKRITTVHKYLKPQRIKHMFWQGNLIELSLSKRVFFCWDCKKKRLPWITSEQLSFIPKSKRYSFAYADQIIKSLGSTSFKTIQELSESSFTTLQRILSERIDPFIGLWVEDETTLSIGLDSHSFSGIKMLPSVTDLTNHRLITILPDEKRITMREFLKNIPHEKKDLIEEVCIDMDSQFKSLIKEELPQARIVVDFFHLVADGNKRISEARTLIQQTEKVKIPKRLFEKSKEHLNPNERVDLNNIFQAYPELKALWKIKEEIRLIHKLPSSPLATMYYQALIRKMKISSYSSVKSWAKTLFRWQNEILQYFKYHTTNGYTEGVNTKLKTIKRLSYGFRNINNYIRKAILSFITISLVLSHYLT
jgi:transposase